MQPQTYDTQGLKAAIIELLQSDAEFGQHLVQLLFHSKELQVVKWDTTTYLISPESKGNFYYEMLPKERQEKHSALREKYRKKKGIRLETIEALQTVFDDAPPVNEIQQLMRK